MLRNGTWFEAKDPSEWATHRILKVRKYVFFKSWKLTKNWILIYPFESDTVIFPVNCFRYLQILIDDRSWCLLSSQKCVSHFIGIWNCYLTNCAFGFSMELMFLWDAIKHLLLPCRVKSVERSNFRPIFQCGKLCRSTFLSNIYHFFGNFSLFK